MSHPPVSPRALSSRIEAFESLSRQAPPPPPPPPPPPFDPDDDDIPSVAPVNDTPSLTPFVDLPLVDQISAATVVHRASIAVALMDKAEKEARKEEKLEEKQEAAGIQEENEYDDEDLLPPIVPAPLPPASATDFSPSSFSLLSALRSLHSASPTLDSSITSTDASLVALRQSIVAGSRRNFLLDRELAELDEKIKLLIKNKIQLKDVVAPMGEVHAGQGNDDPLKGHKSIYEEFLYFLQGRPRFFARLARLLSPGDVPLFVQTVVIDLYGQQYNNREERLLLKLFDECIDLELTECTERAAVFRTNTAVTQMLSAYSKRGQGLALLKDILEEPIQQLFNKSFIANIRKQLGDPDASSSDELNVEIIPSKIYQSLIQDYETNTGKTSPYDKSLTDESLIAAIPAVSALIAHRVALLNYLCNMFLTSITSRLAAVPYGMRYICRSLAIHYQRRFADASRQQIHSLIGGFIYLRFFNPIIVSPQQFNYINRRPNKSEQRALILIAKSIQNLSNGILYGDKEAGYMKPLNTFIEANMTRIQQYFDTLIEIDDHPHFIQMEESIRLDQILEHTKADETLNVVQLSSNQIRQIHGLVSAFKERLTDGDDDGRARLAAILERLGEPMGAELKGADNLTHTLRLTATREGRIESVEAHAKEEELRARQGTTIDILALCQASPILTAYRPRLIHFLASSSPSSPPAPAPWERAAAAANDFSSFLRHCDGADACALAETLEEFITTHLFSFVTHRVAHASSWVSPLDDRSLFSNFILFHLSLTAARQAKALAQLTETHALVESALASIDSHHAHQLERLALYRIYLDNARIAQFGQLQDATKGARPDDAARDSKKKAQPPIVSIRFSHSALVDSGVVVWVSPDVEKRILKSCVYAIHQYKPGVVRIDLLLKKGPIEMNLLGKSLEFVFEELLKLQAAGSSEIDLEMIRLNVNLFIHLINKHFNKQI